MVVYIHDSLQGLRMGLIFLIIVRFLFGMGESGTYPNILIVVSRWFPVNENGRVLSWVGIGSQIGSAIAPLIIVPLAVSFGWRMPFFVIGFDRLCVGVHLLPMVPEFSCRNEKYFDDRKRIISKPIAVTARDMSLLSWITILKQRNTLALMMMYFCCQWANYFFVAWMPVYLQEGRHFSENAMKTITFTLFVAGFVGLLIGGFCSDWLVRKKGLVFGRRFMGMTGLGLCGVFILLAGVSTQ